MTLAQDILHQLEDQGYRLTPSRQRLLETLIAREDGFTAEELVGEAQGVGRATVYRTIRLLVDQGFLCKLAMRDGAPRYKVSQLSHHHHLVCVQCGQVREFRASVIERVLKGLGEQETGTIVGHSIEVFVVCPLCAAKGLSPQ